MSTRRSFLKKAALGGVIAGLVPQNLLAADTQQRVKSKKRSLRIAHITDVHLQDKPVALSCFSRVMHEINSMSDKPDLVINTGDSLMDENSQTRETVEARWKLWNGITATNKIPLKSCLGNHDVWFGPTKELDDQYKNDRHYGKQWAIDELKLPNRFYAFEQAGWKFIGLDSINGPAGYNIDEEQFVWLEKELSATPSDQPILVFSHVPIISVCATMSSLRNKAPENVKFPIGSQHTDAKQIKNLFQKHKKVKLCLSGHVHYRDAVEYLGVKYLCNGAVSGNWWGDPLTLDEDFPPVYTIIDLYVDGSIDYQTIYYNTTV